jgi:hypothetical protein
MQTFLTEEYQGPSLCLISSFIYRPAVVIKYAVKFSSIHFENIFTYYYFMSLLEILLSRRVQIFSFILLYFQTNYFLSCIFSRLRYGST